MLVDSRIPATGVFFAIEPSSDVVYIIIKVVQTKEMNWGIEVLVVETLFYLFFSL